VLYSLLFRQARAIPRHSHPDFASDIFLPHAALLV
jgi:hypothetical protein